MVKKSSSSENAGSQSTGPASAYPKHDRMSSRATMNSTGFNWANGVPSPANPLSTATSADGSRSVSPDTQHGIDQRRHTLGLVKNQVMINYLYQQQGNNGWRSDKASFQEGVILRANRDQFLSYPAEMVDTPLAQSLKDLNIQAAMTIHSAVIKSYLEAFPHSTDMPLLNGLAVQIVKTIDALSTARTHQFAAVVAAENLLIVWEDDAVNMLSRAKTIEWELMQLLWNSNPFDDVRSSKIGSIRGSKIDLTLSEKEVTSNASEIDEEAETTKPRPTIFINTVLVSIGIALILSTLGLGVRALVIEMLFDMGAAEVQGSPYLRFVFLVFTPLWLFFGMFFFNVVVTAIAELIGPISQLQTNSKHYSAKTVPRLTRNLPHVTIQCPVYKEDLVNVIQPTVVSIKKAISTYELQGGSANIFFNDDGMQLISEEDRQARVGFYADNVSPKQPLHQDSLLIISEHRLGCSSPTRPKWISTSRKVQESLQHELRYGHLLCS